MRKLVSIALIASLGVAAATLCTAAEARPYVEVAYAPPGVYAPYYPHRPFFHPGYVRYGGYGPYGFHRYGYFRGGRWCR